MQSIQKRLISNYMAISLFALLILETLFIVVITQYYIGGIEQTLTNHAETAVNFYNRYANKGDIYEKSNFIFENMDINENALVEVIDLNGRIVIDNTGSALNEEVTTWDFSQAKAGRTSSWSGRSNTGEAIMCVSVPIYNENEIVGVLRYVSSLEDAYDVVGNYIFFILWIGVFVLIASAVLAYMMSRRIIVPIYELIRVTEEIAQGNFKVKAIKYHNDEIGQLADAINIMAKEITKSDQAKNEFISSISHELRTPLTSIKGWGETILEAVEEREVTEEGLAIICKETDRLIVLVNDLLDFSKLQAQRIQLKKEEFTIDRLIDDIYSQFGVRARQEKIRLTIIQSRDKVLVNADYNRLKQVLINIVDNAMKFTIDTAQAEIKISSQVIDDQVVMIIEDNGSGITEEDLIQVKEKFYKGSSKKSGTGLGLSIATEIMELHGGQMLIDSVVGKGTKVVLLLPLYYDALAEEEQYE